MMRADQSRLGTNWAGLLNHKNLVLGPTVGEGRIFYLKFWPLSSFAWAAITAEFLISSRPWADILITNQCGL